MTLTIPTLWEILTQPFKNRMLLRMFFMRDLRARYKSSWGGLLWLVLNPIIMLSIYTLVFHRILGVKWGVQETNGLTFALNLYLGLLVFNIFSDSLMAAPHVIRSHANLMKKVRFPTAILPMVPVGLALSDAVVGLAIWFLVYVVINGLPPTTAFALPVVLFPMLLLATGLSWIVASLAVYIRDVAQIVRFTVTGLLFLSPVFFPLKAMPQDLQPILSLNPIAIEIEMLRGILMGGVWPDTWTYLVFFVGCVLTYAVGYIWFDMTRDGFSDVV